MLAQTAGRFTAAVKSRNDFAFEIDDLILSVDSQTRIGIVCIESAPGSIEGAFFNLEFGFRFIEIFVDALIYHRVVSSDSFSKTAFWHLVVLVGILGEFVLELVQSIGDKEVAFFPGLRSDIPFLALNCIAVKIAH